MSSFRLTGVPITLNRRDHRTTHDIEAEEHSRRALRAFVIMIFADLAIVAGTIALTHSWMPNVH